MEKVNLNDFVIDILQDLCEIQSIVQVLKNAVYNENSDIKMSDVGNTLEVITAKMYNINHSLNKYANIAFQ